MSYLGLIAVVAWPAFQKAIVGPMFGPSFWRAKVANGWVPGLVQDFYLELARYKEEQGVDGQLAGDLIWSRLYFGIYLVTMLIAVGVAWQLYTWPDVQLLLAFSAVEFPVAGICMALRRQRSHRQFDEAVQAGFRFSSYRLGRLHQLQP